MSLVSRFHARTEVRSNSALTDEQMQRVAPSIFAEDAHESRSDRYTYIPTIQILNALRLEGFEPFMVAQTRVRDVGQRDHAKHMIRLRHVNQIEGREANEIILLNSHNGTSSYQMLAGIFRFVCANGMICGDTFQDLRIPHKGGIQDQVIESAHTILDGFDLITEKRDSMRAITLNHGEQEAFAKAALTLRYDDETKPAPITEAQLIKPRRLEDDKPDLWSTLNRAQENIIKGGLIGRNAKGRPARTRGVNGIDQNVKLNRALWTLAEEMQKLKAQ